METVGESFEFRNVSTYLPTAEQTNFTTVYCYPTAQITSPGIWVGCNIFFYALPLVLVQICTTLIASRVIEILIRPLRQPTVVSSILGGILLGPSALGRLFPRAQKKLFPDSGFFVARSMGTFGVIFQTFSIAVKMDMSILMMGRKAAIIGLVGFIVPCLAFLVSYKMVQKHTANHIAGGPFLVELAGELSITPFAIVYSYLTDFQLLNTELGHLCLTIGMMNEVFWWVMVLFLDTNKAGDIDLRLLAMQLFPYLLLIIFSVFILRPLMFCLIRRTPRGRKVDQGFVVAILLAALIMAVVTDAIGLSILEGIIVLGLVIPSGPPLGSTIEEKIDTFAKEIFLTMFFASFGQMVNAFEVQDWTGFSAVVSLALFNGLIRLLGTTITAVYFRLPLPQAISLGLILNTTGYLDILEFMTMEAYGLISTQTTVALLLVSVGMTMIGSPVVARLSAHSSTYMPHARRTIQHSKPLAELRLLACIHEQENVPSILNILQATNATDDSPVCIYVMHLVELVGRATPMLIPHNPNKDAFAFASPLSTRIFSAFHNYQRRHNSNALVVQPFTSVSPYKTMHDHVCSLALQKKVNLIILPYHKHQVVAGVTNVVDNALQIINPRILAQAPCSVGIVFDRGSLRGMLAWDSLGNLVFRIGVLFFGGPDDREALSYAARMVEHPSISLTVMRFLSIDGNEENMKERQLDDELVILFRAKSVVNVRINYQEKMVRDGEETVNAIGSIDASYDLMVVGRRQWCNLGLLHGLSIWSENPELGVVGDLCSSSDFFGGKASVLVMQQQTMGPGGVEGSLESYTTRQNSFLHTLAFSKLRR